jgi:acyl-coenzyme A synthetase/AMP-(fatty) acid ligase
MTDKSQMDGAGGPWPLVDPFDPDRVAFWTSGGPITQAVLVERAEDLARRLPDCPLVINYCERRDAFALALLACWVRGQTALFPADRAEHTFRTLRADHSDLYSLSDGDLPFDNPVNTRIDPDADIRNAALDRSPGKVAWPHMAAKVFTSGSTGKPSVNEKTWGMLVTGGKAIPKMLLLDELRQGSVVATVPSQHMYGFETTIMNVLQGGFSAHVERPVYPADIARCLADVPEPRVLVTTPVHLRALVESGTSLPSVDRVISATAPLSADLASVAEERLGAQVWEIYGFTEAGSVAGRRTVESQDWTLRGDFAARSEDGKQFVAWDSFGVRIPFPDVVQILDPGHIRLQGRAQDMVNIAGKRSSLSGLSAQLVEIDGVQDGVFWLPSEDSGMGVVSRLMAFVVAPGVEEREIRAALQKRLDTAFMPRSIVFVDALPRNMTGKLTQGAMKTFAARYTNGNAKT